LGASAPTGLCCKVGVVHHLHSEKGASGASAGPGYPGLRFAPAAARLNPSYPLRVRRVRIFHRGGARSFTKGKQNKNSAPLRSLYAIFRCNGCVSR
jgi:hypothetical protein